MIDERIIKMYKILFDQIESEDHHLRGSIIKRDKDGNSKTSNIKRYTFNSYIEFVNKLDEIIDLCETENARFYLNPTIKSYKDIAFDMLLETTTQIKNGNYEKIKQLYDSVADKNKGVKDKRLWIYDVDNIGDLTKEGFNKVLSIRERLEQNSIEVVLVLPTKTGVHYIVKPHNPNLITFKDLDVELKKNAMTLIYFPIKL